MFRFTMLILLVAVMLGNYSISAEQETDEDQYALIPQINKDEEIITAMRALSEAENYVRVQIEQLEALMAISNTHVIEGTVSRTQLKKVFVDMIKIISDIKERIENKTYAKIFLDYGGLERVVFPNLKKRSNQLRSSAIILLKLIFDVIPEESKYISVTESINLLNFLKSEKSVTNKALVIYIFSKWLPDNPKLQKEVLDNNGMEAFYEILPTIGTQLKVLAVNMLDSLITEHLNSKDELQEAYNEVGLFNVLKRHDTCDGLFTLFEDLFASAPENMAAIDPMVSLMEKVLPFCKEIYKNDSKMDNFLKDMGRFYTRENRSIDSIGPVVEGAERVLRVIKKYEEELGPAVMEKNEL